MVVDPVYFSMVSSIKYMLTPNNGWDGPTPPPWMGRVFRDEAPSGARLPYIVLHDDISVTPHTVGDGEIKSLRKRFQLDLWQHLSTEDFHMWKLIYDRFKRFSNPIIASHVHILSGVVESWNRTVDLDQRTAQYAFDLRFTYEVLP